MKNILNVRWEKWSKTEFELSVEQKITAKEIAEYFHKDISGIYAKFRKFKVKPYVRITPRTKKQKKAYKCIKCGNNFYRSQYLDKGLCRKCGTQSENPNVYSPKTPKNEAYYDKLIELRESGWGYKAIAKELGINKSIVSYICNPKTRQTAKKKVKRYQAEHKFSYYFTKRLSNFFGRKKRKYSGLMNKCEDWNHSFRSRVSLFRRRGLNVVGKNGYSYMDALEYFNLVDKKTIKCYLTGQLIDITKDNYSLDHIKCTSKNGENSLQNMGICTFKANMSKSDMDLTEYLDLCKQVLINYGFEVKDPENLQANIDNVLANHRKNE